MFRALLLSASLWVLLGCSGPEKEKPRYTYQDPPPRTEPTPIPPEPEPVARPPQPPPPPPPPTDTTAPIITVESPPDGHLVNTRQVAVRGLVDDRKVEAVRIQAVPYPVTDGRFEASVALIEGENRLELEAFDPAGNRGTASLSVRVDTIAPEVTIKFPQAGRRLSQAEVPVAVDVRAPDLDRVSVNGVPAQPHASIANLFQATLVLARGEDVVIEAVAVDKAGNVGKSEVRVAID